MTRNKVAIVDDEDFEFLTQWKWHATHSKSGWYATRTDYGGGRKKEAIKMHRLLMGLPKGDKRLVDHHDGDGLNNQRHNLRVCNNSQNTANSKKSGGRSSQFKGVSKFTDNKKRKHKEHVPKEYWKSEIRVNKKSIFLGLFPYTPEGEIAAARAYDEAAKKYFGYFSKTNFN